MPPLPGQKQKPTADRTWGNLNKAIRNDVPRSLLHAKKSILNMQKRRRSG